MAGRSSQFRKFAKHGASGDLGEEDTNQGPVKAPNEVGFVPTHLLTVGDGTSRVGYEAGSFGDIDPGVIGGTALTVFESANIGGVLRIASDLGVQFNGAAALAVSVEGYTSGASFAVTWNGSDAYTVTDAALNTYLNTQIGNDLRVRIELA